MDLPYVVSVGDGRLLAIDLSADWVKADRDGRPLLLPPAVRVLDRLRAVFLQQTAVSPGYVLSLREALGLTQAEFASRLGVSKMTVSRWECGRIRPAKATSRLIFALQAQAKKDGLVIDSQKRSARHAV